MPRADRRPHQPVLVVDDEDDTREGLAELLKLNGYSVATATHGQEALEWLSAAPRKPCLILLDLMMPVMNGWKFRDEQLRNPGIAEVPVVLVTAIGDRRDLEARLKPAAVLTKPLDLDRLLQIVADFC